MSPYKALKCYTPNGVHDAPMIQREYRKAYGIGRIAEDVWDKNDFTYGFEYGLLAMAAKVKTMCTCKEPSKGMEGSLKCVDCGGNLTLKV